MTPPGSLTALVPHDRGTAVPSRLVSVGRGRRGSATSRRSTRRSPASPSARPPPALTPAPSTRSAGTADHRPGHLGPCPTAAGRTGWKVRAAGRAVAAGMVVSPRREERRGGL